MTDARKSDELWMPLLVDRYMRDTDHLTTEQHGAYLLLIMAGWKRGGILPAQDAQLAAIAKLAPGRWRTVVKPVLMPFFRPDGDGGLVQKRLMLEIERVQKLSFVRANAARSRSKTPTKHQDLLPKKPAKGQQLGDYRGSPTPPSAPSVPPTPNTEVAVAPSARERGTDAGEACKAMRAAGIADTNPSNPELLAMLAQGITVDELVSASATALTSHAKRPFKYALQVAQSERERAARVSLVPATTASGLTGNARFMASSTPAQWPPASDLELTEHEHEPEASHVADARARG